VKQGTEGRGKEIYDPESDAWYWLDAVDGGKRAVNKDVYLESVAGSWSENVNGTGKWVRYDENGHMVKGWDTTEEGTYYFDLIYGTMAKGYVVIEGELYCFDRITGIGTGQPCSWEETYGWVHTEDGSRFWYEDGVKQGTEGRGKEIYDPVSDAWYWLDSVEDGRIAVSKDVYQESFAGDWAENEDGTGKWVRYDENGRMVKGWQTTEEGTYYFDEIFGTMAKGTVTIDGEEYRFDGITGILVE
jgi:glucan-binding YG repeat protein